MEKTLVNNVMIKDEAFFILHLLYQIVIYN